VVFNIISMIDLDLDFPRKRQIGSLGFGYASSGNGL
jgi:hypothetical protein